MELNVGGGQDLPEISTVWEASPYRVMEQLQQFDQQAGYPFAWYFYMLHGNRISHSVGGIVAKAIQKGVMKPLPDEMSRCYSGGRAIVMASEY